MENKKDKIEELYRLILELESLEDCRDLFDDLCTMKEIEKMAERVYAAKLLLEGKTYNQVIAQADISSATLSRVSRCVQYGNGYSRLLTEQKEKGVAVIFVGEDLDVLLALCDRILVIGSGKITGSGS